MTCEITAELVNEVIEVAGQREQRRRKLPAVAVLFFVLGLCLFSGADSHAPPGYRSVWRTLTRQLRPPAGEPDAEGDARRAVPTRGALSRARQRLGVKPVELLFERVQGPRATPDTPGAFALGLRLVCWDGTTLDVPATEENLDRFGCPARGGDPQIRLLTLIECGTRAVIEAAFDGINQASEQALARRMLAALGPDMLLLADRNFPGYELWGQAQATGAALVWRIKSNQHFPVLEELPDGSYYSVMRTPPATSDTARPATPDAPHARKRDTTCGSSSTPSPCTPMTAIPTPNDSG